MSTNHNQHQNTNTSITTTTAVTPTAATVVTKTSIGNASSNNNCKSSSSNAEQPQTKRQKIEQIKSKNLCTNSKITSTATTTATSATTTTTTPTTIITAKAPDIIDTGGEHLLETNSASNVNGNGNSNQHLCSSLSSSAHSISTPSSSNNSPTSTPSSSRATSLSQLLNVQNLLNILPGGGTKPMNPSITHHTMPTNTIGISFSKSAKTNNLTGTKSETTIHSSSSMDEVDRVTLPDLLPITMSINSSHNSKFNTSVDENIAAQDMREFEDSLTKQCLCGVSERTLRKPFQSHYSLDNNGQKRIANLSEWPTSKLMQFLSNLQLLFDIYLKQNSKGFICARIMDVCDALIRNDHNLIDEIIVLAAYNNKYVQFLAGRVLAAFLVIAKQEMDDNWLKKLVDNLFNFDRLDHIAVQKIHFSLEIIKRIVEWKDIDLHPLEDEIANTRGNDNMSSDHNTTEQSNLTSSESVAQHGYLHFSAQQPSLENNYFAVHFRDAESDLSASGSNSNTNSSSNFDTTRRHNISNFTDSRQFQDRQEPNNSLNFQPSSSSIYFVQDTHTDSQSHNHLPNNNLSYNPTPYTYQNPSAGQYEEHTNEHPQAHYATAQHHPVASGCHIITLTDSESFDTTHLKCVTIKILENKWPAVVQNMSSLIANHLSIENVENCILNFLQLWENIISVKANLSIVETLPFYAHLDKFELLLNRNLSCTIYKQMLCLFNEALCYGSTLALQDMLPDETCHLAHQIVRHVKDFRILESLPRRQPENIVSLIGFKRPPIAYRDGSLQSHYTQVSSQNLLTGGEAIEMDKTILQKMVLLVLKSIAVTVKEIRSDSSDSSIDSTDYDAFQDMVLIERTIRDVLRNLEAFIKHTLEFHPECHFSKILIHLFDDQDDHLIEAMVCTLDVTAGISFRNNAFPELVAMLNPVYTFLEFLKMISNSSDLLLDLLVSNETCFLLFLLRFLKYIRMNWSMFVQSCQDFGMGANTLDEAMSVLTRLRLQISRLVSRQLYPYDISPVLRLLESCESLYEGNELS